MKLKAGEGQTFTGAISFNGLVFPGIAEFTIRSGWAWLHWFIEAGLIAAGTTWIGFEVASRPFSESASGWYGPAKRVGNVDGELMGHFLNQLRADRYSEAGRLMVEGEDLSHPTVEVYAQQCPDDPRSNVLLTVKRTYWGAKGGVIRHSPSYRQAFHRARPPLQAGGGQSSSRDVQARVGQKGGV